MNAAYLPAELLIDVDVTANDLADAPRSSGYVIRLETCLFCPLCVCV